MTEHVFRVRRYQRAFHEAWTKLEVRRFIEIAHRDGGATMTGRVWHVGERPGDGTHAGQSCTDGESRSRSAQAGPCIACASNSRGPSHIAIP